MQSYRVNKWWAMKNTKPGILISNPILFSPKYNGIPN